ncbi:unnamed protein product, partial [Porites lobata]
MDCQDDVNAKRFTDILESFDLKQRVCAGTHRNGHTLDLLINKSDDNMLNNMKVYDANISDHSAVLCDVSIRKPQFRKEVIFYRKLRSLDMESFLSDVADCPLVIDPSSDLDHLVQHDALANSFADYFIDKIDRIHATLIEKNSAQGNDANEVTLGNYVECNSVFSDFINVSYEDIKGLALRSINKSCVLDPLPAVVMKECFNLLTPVLTNI